MKKENNIKWKKNVLGMSALLHKETKKLIKDVKYTGYDLTHFQVDV